jgi:hypothetical protein
MHSFSWYFGSTVQVLYQLIHQSMTQFQMKKEKVKSRMILQVCLLSIEEEPSYQKAVDHMQWSSLYVHCTSFCVRHSILLMVVRVQS